MQHDDSLAEARGALARVREGMLRNPADLQPIVAALDQIASALDRLQERDADAQNNLAVQLALLDERLLRMERNPLFAAWHRFKLPLSRLLPRIRAVVAGPREGNSAGRDQAAYDLWVAHETAAAPGAEETRGACLAWKRQPKISIVLTPGGDELPRALVTSIRQQAYSKWELCLAIQAGGEPAILPAIRELEAASGAVRYAAGNAADAASALNCAADLAGGEYLVFLAEPGIFSPHALYRIVEALQNEAADLIYADEDHLDVSGRRTQPVFKPDWSPDLLAAGMYLGGLLAVRRAVFLAAGGFSNRHPGAHFLDLAVRLSGQPLSVCHVPRILSHRLQFSSPESISAGSAAGSPVRRVASSRPMTAVICSKSASLLEKCLQGLRATAKQSVRQIVVVAHEESAPDAALRAVIKQAGATLLPYSGRFDFSAMNNLGARLADSPHLLFLNDDVVATQPEWAEMLGEEIARPEVGVVGAVLRYPSGLVQHAGIVIGIGDGVGHVGRYASSSALWPWLLDTRNVSAVTGACLAIRKELFDELGGFDAEFPNNYNDIDLCFRARDRGYRVLCVAAPGLVHAECQSRPGIVAFEERFRFYRRWARLLARPDPYYSESLAPSETIALNFAGDRWHRRLLNR